MDVASFVAESKKLKGVRGRYAPSPSGSLHLGNLRTALLSWLQVRLSDGEFVLRIEDLDQPRMIENGTFEMIEELHWLGIDWDEGPDVGGEFGPYVQSERIQKYDEFFNRLRDLSLLYPCYCSRREVREAGRAPHGSTPVYPGFCRQLSSEVQREKGKTKMPSWRYKVGEEKVFFEDKILGTFEETMSRDVGDFIVKRADGIYSYQFSVSVDDWLMRVTDVVRGEDLVSSTGRQMYMIRGFRRRFEKMEEGKRLINQGVVEDHVEAMRYWHVPLFLGKDGERLAKRSGSESVKEMKKKGEDSERVVKMLAESIGISVNYAKISPLQLLEELREAVPT